MLLARSYARLRCAQGKRGKAAAALNMRVQGIGRILLLLRRGGL